MKHFLCKLTAFLGYLVVRTNCFKSSYGLNSKSIYATLSTRLPKLRSNPNHQDEIPLIASLAEVTPPIKERYFFPGHNGGENSPKSVRKIYGTDIFALDLPELDGLDNIHNPEGPLLRALLLASELFGSFRSWFLVNGSTSGILSAILATVQLHQRHQLSEVENAATESLFKTEIVQKRSIMILGRDSHKASFDGLRLGDCDAALLPCINDIEFGVPLGVDFDSISHALEKYGSEVCGVLLTRPSYQGVMCSSARLKEIVELCHSKGVPVIVDEAHGSHLRFLGRPDMLDALACGADIVVQSSHKTLTALSQAAMMHLGNKAFSFHRSRIDSRIDRDSDDREGDSDSGKVNTKGDTAECPTEAAGIVLHDCFSMLTTTSPNMALLASLDATRAQMARDGADMIQGAAASADEIRYELRLQNALRIEKADGPVGGGVELLDDSASIRPAKRLKTNKESESKVRGSDSHRWLVDPLRLTVRFPGRLALDVDDKMCEERGIYCELNLQSCISYAIPPGSTSKSLKVLRKVLLEEGEAEVDEEMLEDAVVDRGSHSDVVLGDVTYLHTDAAKKRNSVPLRLITESDRIAAIGRISAETICPYPPGIPVVIRGERLTAGHVKALTALQAGLEADVKGRESGLGSGCTVTGCSDRSLQTVRVIAE